MKRRVSMRLSETTEQALRAAVRVTGSPVDRVISHALLALALSQQKRYERRAEQVENPRDAVVRDMYARIAEEWRAIAVELATDNPPAEDI